MSTGEKIFCIYIIFGFPLSILPIRGIAISRDLERMPTLKEIFLGAALNAKTAKSLRRGCLVLWGISLFMLFVFLNASKIPEAAMADDNGNVSAASAFFIMNSLFLGLLSFHLRQIFFNGLFRPDYFLELKKKGKQPNNHDENALFFREFGFFLILMEGRKRLSVI